MTEDFFGYDDQQAAPKKRDNLFLWTVLILLLIGVAFACWLGSFYVFGHPEQPKAYRLLQKIKPLPPPIRFEVTAAPPGEFLSAQRLFERFSKYTRLELERENASLLRDYLKNYKETKKLVPYVTGRFNIVETRELGPQDFFDSGVVSLAQSVDYPQTLIEHLYTAPAENVPALRDMLQRGLDMNVKRSDDCAAVLHAARLPDGKMKFTVLSVLYGTYGVKQGTGMFSLEPPRDIHIEAGLPFIPDDVAQSFLKAYADFRRKRPASGANVAANATPAPAGREIVRVETSRPGATVPETGLPSATPIPAPPRSTPRPTIVARATPAATPPQVAMLTTPRPAPPPVPVATPLPVDRPEPRRMEAPPTPRAQPPPLVAPSGVPLRPFNPSGGEVVARPDPARMPSSGATWRTYPPGQAPPARTLAPEDAGTLASRGVIDEPLYLRGSFRVTATGANRAVLRDSSLPDEQSPRILAEYPAGFVPPAEKEIVVRDGSRPFLIYDIRRGADGVITIYVREITQPTP
jgi:hypothetical protein